jgi:hypothetical protein
MFQSTLRCGALGCALASAFASVAGAQLLSHRDLSASMAITIAQTAIETCKANGYAVSATVVGRNGEIIVLGQSLDAEQTQKLIDGLVNAGWLREITTSAGPSGGRPARRWLVNPLLFTGAHTVETAETSDTSVFSQFPQFAQNLKGSGDGAPTGDALQ